MGQSLYTFDGTTKTLAEWAKDHRCAVVYKTLVRRIHPMGWSFERALLTPNEREVHGKAFPRTREYRIWSNMKRRCNPKNLTCYGYYAGRGITVCERWMKFTNFLADMGEAPTPQHTLDRIDNNGNYEPDNCRWATRKEQSNNTRFNTVLSLSGNVHTVAEWTGIIGVSRNTIRNRIKKGLPIDRVLSCGRGKYSQCQNES